MKLAGVDISSVSKPSSEESSSYTQISSSSQMTEESSSDTQDILQESSVPEPVSIHILGVGDNLIHDAIYKQAQTRAGGEGYDFSFVYERVAEDVYKRQPEEAEFCSEKDRQGSSFQRI